MSEFEDQLLLSTLEKLDKTVEKLSTTVESHSKALAVIEARYENAKWWQMISATLFGGFVSTLAGHFLNIH